MAHTASGPLVFRLRLRFYSLAQVYVQTGKIVPLARIPGKLLNGKMSAAQRSAANIPPLPSRPLGETFTRLRGAGIGGCFGGRGLANAPNLNRSGRALHKQDYARVCFDLSSIASAFGNSQPRAPAQSLLAALDGLV